MAPQKFSLKSPNSTSIEATWTDIPTENQFGIILNCYLKWKRVDDSRQVQTTKITKITKIPSQPLSYVIQAMKKYTEYEVMIACATIKGIGPYTRPLTVRTQEDGKSYLFKRPRPGKWQ